MGTVRDLCSRAILLKQGRLAFYGETRLAIQQYLAGKPHEALPELPAGEQAKAAAGDELQAIRDDSLWTAPAAEHQEGAGRLLCVAAYDAQGLPSTSFRLGSELRLKVAYFPAGTGQTHVAVVIWNKFNHVITSVSSSSLGLAPPQVQADGVAIFEITIGLQLEAGNYSLMVSLSHPVAPNHGKNLDSSPRLGPLSVSWDYERERAPFLGMVGLPARASFKAVAADAEEHHVQ
jgi:lipopolysaccharide transport system ATP-binding protein